MPTEPTLFDDRICQLGEGPQYDPVTRRVIWVDILASRILWRSIDDSTRGEWRTSAHIGAAVPRRDGGMVFCLPTGPVLADADGSLHHLTGFAEADEAAGVTTGPGMRANDAQADPGGRLWLGTMAYDERPGAGALYRLDPGAPGPVRVIGDVSISNGLGWSPDGSRMYYIDTPTRRIDVFDYDTVTATPVNRREFAQVDRGFPDGLTVDADGAVWVALWDGGAVRRYLPDGTLDREVPLPVPKVTSCVFAGDDYRTLVITTVGPMYAYRPGDVAGLPGHVFAG